jgi:sn-glycerol 3-phosphate transport system substrate-binding protein
MTGNAVTRRAMLRAGIVASAGMVAMACQPKVVEVERVVTKEVEKIVEKPVEVEKVVKETVVVTQKEIQMVTPTPAPKRAGEVTTLRYGTFWAADRVQVVNRGIELFRGKYPDIAVAVEMGGGQYRDKLATQFAAGTEPDCGIGDLFSLPKYHDAGLHADMQPACEVRGINVKETHGLIGIEFSGDKLLDMPWVNSGHVMFYNKDMFRQYGAPDPQEDLGGYWSWDQWLDAMRTIKQNAEDKVSPIWVAPSSVTFHMMEFIYGRCARLFDFTTNRYTFNEPRTIEAFEWIMSLYEEGLIIDVDAAKEGQLAGMADLFSGQAVAMRKIGTGAVMSTLRAVGDAFEWDLVPSPTMSGLPEETLSLVTADPNFVSAKTPQREEAMEFIIYLASEDVQNILSQNKLLIPSLKSASRREDAFLKPPPQNIYSMLQPWDNGRAITDFFHHETKAANAVMTREMDYVVLGEKSVQEACDVMQKECNELVRFETPYKPINQWFIDFPGSVASCK